MSMEASAIAVLISTAGAVIVSVLSQLQHSRCTTLRCCCVDCTRDVTGLVPEPEPEVPDLAALPPSLPPEQL